jgi:phosphotransacetylase
MNMLISSHGPLFFCDTDINADPTAEEIADITLLAAEEVSRFVPPKIALLSHSSFGSHKSRQARKMAEALQSSASVPRTWKWTAKCVVTLPCPRHCAVGCSCIRR